MNTINYVHTESYHNIESPNRVMPFVIDLVKPLTVLDVGCGTGTWLKVAKDLGVKTIMGVDGIRANKDLLLLSDEEFLLQNLTEPIDLERKFDLVICLEVAEHLPESAADNLIETLTKHSDIILFSAGVPGQGGQAHINEQWPVYWQKKFSKHGFLVYDFLREKFWEDSNIQWWYKQNMFIYSKPNQACLLNYKPTEHIRNMIHPDLLLEIDRDKNILSNIVTRPKIIPSLKLLIKALIKKYN